MRIEEISFPIKPTHLTEQEMIQVFLLPQLTPSSRTPDL